MNCKLHNTILAFSVTGVMLFVGTSSNRRTPADETTRRTAEVAIDTGTLPTAPTTGSIGRDEARKAVRSRHRRCRQCGRGHRHRRRFHRGHRHRGRPGRSHGRAGTQSRPARGDGRCRHRTQGSRNQAEVQRHARADRSALFLVRTRIARQPELSHGRHHLERWRSDLPPAEGARDRDDAGRRAQARRCAALGAPGRRRVPAQPHHRLPRLPGTGRRGARRETQRTGHVRHRRSIEEAPRQRTRPLPARGMAAGAGTHPAPGTVARPVDAPATRRRPDERRRTPPGRMHAPAQGLQEQAGARRHRSASRPAARRPDRPQRRRKTTALKASGPDPVRRRTERARPRPAHPARRTDERRLLHADVAVLPRWIR